MLELAPIQAAIAQVLTGALGSTRTVDVGTFARGGEEGDNVSRRQAQSLVMPRFSVQFTGFSPHGATPVSNTSPYRLDTLPVLIRFTYKLGHTVLEQERDAVNAAVMQDGDIALQALRYRANLRATVADGKTQIVSGCLSGPYTFEVNQDWQNHMIVAELRSSVILKIPQAVAA
jgi:hypothetical protein